MVDQRTTAGQRFILYPQVFPAGEFLKSKIGDYAKIRNIFIAGEERG